MPVFAGDAGQHRRDHSGGLKRLRGGISFRAGERRPDIGEVGSEGSRLGDFRDYEK